MSMLSNRIPLLAAASQWIGGALFTLFLSATVANADEDTKPIDVLVVVGAAGEQEFGTAFSAWADVWQSTCDRANLNLLIIGPDKQEVAHRDQLHSKIESIASVESIRPLWLILIGHGTWDGASADFNLVGPDVSAKELGDWIAAIKRPLLIANCTSSSGPFINRLSGPNRVIVTATKSGTEKNYARFGQYFAAAFNSVGADLDHDDEVSMREAFLKACADADLFYKEQGRLATEHALLDDNNDKKGSSYALVRGRAKSKGDGKIDGDLASRFSIPVGDNSIQLTDEQLTTRNELESQLRDLQTQHAQDDPAVLREKALPVLIELAKLYAPDQSPADESVAE
ncbi:MAG: hypothetical protein KDB00_12075 [Planctomycetales bacterium]|nr:hypothetical protein [Planctomycetales bacterium]